MLTNPRIYGQAPFTLALAHGGPGAAGEMAPVARELAKHWGVLEPWQTAASLAGQIKELKTILETYAAWPVILIGFSWGAWLSLILAAQYPSLIRKLILISCPSFSEEDAATTQVTRLQRLSATEVLEVQSLFQRLDDPRTENKNTIFAQLGAWFTKTDAYQPIPDETEEIEHQYAIYQKVWPEAAGLRRSGKLLAWIKNLQCPVVAIHGDYDPHPAQGVQKPLSSILINFRFILLPHCGHKPWIECQARENFYSKLQDELP